MMKMKMKKIEVREQTKNWKKCERKRSKENRIRGHHKGELTDNKVIDDV